MRIIQQTDFRPDLHRVAVPVRYIGGQNDMVVPVHRELKTLARHLPESCDFQSRLLAGARHVIIASHPGQTARHITDWVRKVEGRTADQYVRTLVHEFYHLFQTRNMSNRQLNIRHSLRGGSKEKYESEARRIGELAAKRFRVQGL
jgi:hypothetical protein